MIYVDKINRSGNLAEKLCRDGSVVNKAYRSGELIYQRMSYSEYYTRQYLTFEALSDGAFYFNSIGSLEKTIEWSNDGVNWNEVVPSESGTLITNVSVGDKIVVRGNNDCYCEIYKQSFFRSSCLFKVSGNIMSLIYGENYYGQTAFTKEHALCSLFYGCTGLTDASNLILPATTLTNDCYRQMFEGCSSLTKAPELRIPTLVNSCYLAMFIDCTNLTYIKCLATDITAQDSTYNWVSGVSQTGIFVKSPNMSSWTTGDNGIPSGWTVIDAT